ncbi:MAG TPA: hypothetical protein VGG39_09770 [Polyangiaceae bacterium]|jgi:hypothetical protein
MLRSLLVVSTALATGDLFSLTACGGRIAGTAGSGVEAGAGSGSGGGSGFGSSTSGGFGGSGSGTSSGSSGSGGGHGGGSGGKADAGSSTGGGSTSGGSGSTSGGGASWSGTSGSSSGFPEDASTGECPDDIAFTPATYPAAQAHQGVCHPADVAAFLAACGDEGSTAACSTWEDDNLAGVDGDGGTPCGNCILDVDGTGASFVSQPNPEGFQIFGPNYGACIALLDPTNGPTCAPAYDADDDCESIECADCADASSFATCSSTVDGTGGVCSKENAAASAACATDFADGGAAAECSPGAASGTSNPDWQLIIGLICGDADGG